MRRNKSDIQVFSLSFLDVLSCALGAVLILLVLLPISEPKPEIKSQIIAKLKVLMSSIISDNEVLGERIEQLKAENIELKNQEPSEEEFESISPSLFGLPLEANYGVFIVDVSGSMSWQGSNLYDTIESLLSSCEMKYFRFIFFDSEVYFSGNYWPHDWLIGSENNKIKILKTIKDNLVDYIISEPAGTNSGGALFEALKYKNADVIYFITDGHPTVGETNINNILSSVKYNNKHNAIINSIMIGLPGTTLDEYGRVVFLPDANPKALYDFLHDLADQNNGVYVGR
jgi:hypothetical protein